MKTKKVLSLKALATLKNYFISISAQQNEPFNQYAFKQYCQMIEDNINNEPIKISYLKLQPIYLLIFSNPDMFDIVEVST